MVPKLFGGVEHLFDALIQAFKYLLDLSNGRMNQENGHRFSPPVNFQKRLSLAAIENEIGQARL